MLRLTCRPAALVVVTLLTGAACASTTPHLAAMQAAAQAPLADESALDGLPAQAAARVSLANPASAPCRRASKRDIVCPLVAMDGAFYATLGGMHGAVDANVDADKPAQTLSAPQLATDE
jgi:putative hemolysin